MAVGKLNKHGLSRAIPETTKSEARKRCNFGCVICGSIPFDYDHFIVPWAEATEHNPDDIILLCATHHRQKTTGLLDTETIKTALTQHQGANNTFRFKLEGTSQSFKVHWPHNDLSASRQGIVVDGKPILEIETQDDPLAPILISGAFSDYRGNDVCVIDRNEFVTTASNVGDFKLVGNRFSYTALDGTKALQFRLTPAGIHIEHLFHVRGDAFVRAMPDHLMLGNLTSRMRAYGNMISDCKVAIELQSFTDDWNFAEHDITKLPGANTLADCSMSNCYAGLHIGAPPRYHPSYTFRWAF